VLYVTYTTELSLKNVSLFSSILFSSVIYKLHALTRWIVKVEHQAKVISQLLSANQNSTKEKARNLQFEILL